MRQQFLTISKFSASIATVGSLVDAPINLQVTPLPRARGDVFWGHGHLRVAGAISRCEFASSLPVSGLVPSVDNPLMMRQCAWAPISTAPEDGTPVLVFHPDWEVIQVGIHDEETNTWQQPSGDLLETPFYWQALPAPPPPTQ
jgi:hypothetical protein